MKILIKQFLSKNHSWSHTAYGLATSFKNQGHQVDLFSTNGIEHLPPHLKENLIGYVEENQSQVYGRIPSNDYDIAYSYTAMKNFQQYLSHGRVKLGVFCYEWLGKNILPNGFAKAYRNCDYVCPPSEFAKKGFMDSGIPESSIKVIPHGINVENYQKTTTIDLKTNKKFKILANIAQNHKRKNIPGLLEAYGKAFTNKDDVCLILKAKEKPLTQPFDVSVNSCIQDFKRKYPNHAELKLFSQYLDDVSDLYRSVDCLYTLSYCEAYYIPGIEMLAAGKMNIASSWGGQLDFLNDTNSLLVTGSEVRADPTSMYWESKPNAIWFKPNIDDAVDKLRWAYHNHETFNEKVKLQMLSIHEKYSWNNIANQFLDLYK